LRNEVKSKASLSVQRWPQEDGHFYVDEDRTQRHTLALRDVAYLIEAQIQVADDCDAHPAKFRDQFRRRVQRGQCYTRPYLGCREFAAAFAPPTGDEHPIDVSQPLGRMLLDLDYEGREGRGEPRFFEATLDHGVVRYPERNA
jgi:CRISPR-associated protein Cas5d